MYMNTILPGHAISLHFVVLVGGPLQKVPPPLGAGRVQLLFRVFTPAPQLVLQLFHEPQFAQAPFSLQQNYYRLFIIMCSNAICIRVKCIKITTRLFLAYLLHFPHETAHVSLTKMDAEALGAQPLYFRHLCLHLPLFFHHKQGLLHLYDQGKASLHPVK